MSVVVTVGCQWGDEGKGKIVDFLGSQADVISRHQGGNNAGHTIHVGAEKYVFHLVPSGILDPDSLNLVGNGVVLDPFLLIKELDSLQAKGIRVTPERFQISGQAHIILPYHCRLDELEETRKGKSGIGTTKRGIGPAYMDKASRAGIRLYDLCDDEALLQRLEMLLPLKNAIIEKVYGSEPFDLTEMFDSLKEAGKQLYPYVSNTVDVVHKAISSGKKVLCEGAQGTMLDIDYGTYPFVTSSNTTVGGVCTGSGIPPRHINFVLGIAKAYATRVGSGPFPTEVFEEEADRIRNAGPVGEFGATTGRPRRCGWLDIPLLRYTCRVNGIDGLALTRLDVLNEVPEIKVCTQYKHRGNKMDMLPADMNLAHEIEPVYQALPSWQDDLSEVTDFEELPKPAKKYISNIENWLGVPVVMISVGPARHQTIVRQKLF